SRRPAISSRSVPTWRASRSRRWHFDPARGGDSLKHIPAAGRLLVALILAGLASPAVAAPQLAKLFSDHAVLQRGRPIAIWGRADPGERLTVTLGETSRDVTAGRDGAW